MNHNTAHNVRVSREEAVESDGLPILHIVIAARTAGLQDLQGLHHAVLCLIRPDLVGTAGSHRRDRRLVAAVEPTQALLLEAVKMASLSVRRSAHDVDPVAVFAEGA